jgi:hypothetical protein
VLGSVAQFERQLLIERTMAGLKAARAEGRTGGNRRKMTPQDIEQARRHMMEGKLKAREVARIFRVSERSLWADRLTANSMNPVERLRRAPRCRSTSKRTGFRHTRGEL